VTSKLIPTLCLLVCLALAGAQEVPRYTNPVVTPIAADPDIIRAENGSFYLYATQDNWADGSGDHYIPIFRSSDLVNWTFVEDAFSLPPAWKESGGFYWAPDISQRNGTYYLYYAYSLWGDPNPCIGLATSKSPKGPWEDLGRAVFCSEDIGVENSIDPFVWYEDGERTMIWGSFNGIYAVALSGDGTEAVGETTLLADTRFEAPYIVKRDSYYHLFLAAGSCCDGEWSTYTTYAGRSEDLLGPYLDSQGRDLRDGGGDILLSANDTWVGPGHNAVVQDDAGADWIVYHAIPRTNPRLGNGVNRRPTLIDRLEWQNGWPKVKGPTSGEQNAPHIKTSE